MNRFATRMLICAMTAWLAQACDAPPAEDPESGDRQTYRFASFNIAMGLPQAGGMAEVLQSGTDPRLISLANVLQAVRPDVVLLNEFDYDPSVEAADLLNRNYLARATDGLDPIAYPYSFRAPVNTGVDSGLDLDGNGEMGEPTDAWGFGIFPGQYGMLILSRFPLEEDGVRSFQTLRWSQLPDPLRPRTEDGQPYYPDAVWAQLRLSSKNHLDVPIRIGERLVHLLASHPTPPVFDGPEDRNGKRNHDELAFWAHYVGQAEASWIVDDDGQSGGLAQDALFIIAGDLNADPVDGDAHPGAIAQLLEHPAIDAGCTPRSKGGAEAAVLQAGINLQHRGDPAADTSDFNDTTSGNYRLDYVLPYRGLTTVACGVFWPGSEAPLHQVATFSDHRLVWIDVEL